MAKPRCFKQTNCCAWFKYVFAVAQFIFLLLIFVLENILSLVTIILTFGCKYYHSRWQWYTTLNKLEHISSIPIPLSPIASHSIKFKDDDNHDKTIKVLTQNLWIHYLAPSPCKTKRLRAFVSYLKNLKSQNELYDVLILQEIFGLRFGFFIRCPHLIYLVNELYSLGYIYYTKPSGILPYFGQNGGVMIFSKYTIDKKNVSKFYHSDEWMLRKGFAIATIKIPKLSTIHEINTKDKFKFKSPNNNKNNNKNSNNNNPVLVNDFSPSTQTNDDFSPSNQTNDDSDDHTQTTPTDDQITQSQSDSETEISQNKPTNESMKSPHPMQKIQSNPSSPSGPAVPSPIHPSSQIQLSQVRNRKSSNESIKELFNNENDNTNLNLDSYYYLCCGTGHCDPYRVKTILRQINQFALGMQYQFDLFIKQSQLYSENNERKDNDNDDNNDINNNHKLDMIVGGDFNTRNVDLQQGLRDKFLEIGNGMKNVWEMSLYCNDPNKLSNVTYRSNYITKCKLWLSILSCGLIPLPSLNNIKYTNGHCLDHILTNIDENRIKKISVVDTRWKNIFVSDHMGVMIQFKLK